MTVSGKRAGVEFVQTIQTPIVSIAESSLPGVQVGAWYQIIEALVVGAANPSALAKDANGNNVLYNGDPSTIYFFSDQVNLTGALALPSLIDKALILPNTRTAGAVAEDPYFVVLLNPPGTDEFVQLELGDQVTLEVNANGETVGIFIEGGVLDSLGQPFSNVKKANILIGLRALRRDYVRKALRTDNSSLATLAGGTFGPENPLSFALQKYFEAAGSVFGYGVGVDEVTDGEPEGTYEAFLRALDVVETIEGYVINALTYQRDVLNAAAAHVLQLSTPEGRKERRGLVGRTLPTVGPNDVLVTGVGSLDLVHAFMRHTGGVDTYDIFGEAKQGGSAVNNNLTFEIIDTTPGAVTITAGPLVLETQTNGAAAAGGSVWTSVGALFVTNGVAVGDKLRYATTGSATYPGSGVITSNRFQDSSRNFKEIGVKAGDELAILTGPVAVGTHVIRGLATTTNPYDTLILEGTLVPTAGVFTYSIELTLSILIVNSETSITVDAIFDSLLAAQTYFVDDAVVKAIQVDKHNNVVDSVSLVAELNSNEDAAALATFYVGPNALFGTQGDVAVVAVTPFLGGVNTFTQFYTNSDISSVVTGSFLDLESENRDFAVTFASIRTWNGSVIVADPDGDLTGLKVTESFGIYVLGASLTIVTPMGTEDDIQAQADTLAAFPINFKSRRIIAIWPDLAVTTVNSTQVEVAGYYLGATLSGLVASVLPEQGHSELPIPGWESLQNSNDRFSEAQLEQLTAGGWWVYVQDTPGGAIVCRKQYTTDPSGDITAEFSFTTIADSIQKDIRLSVNPLLGRNNITPQLVERVRLIIDSVIRRYQNRLAIKSGTLNSLEPSSEPGDLTTLVGDLSLEFYGPFNLLRVRVVL